MRDPGHLDVFRWWLYHGGRGELTEVAFVEADLAQTRQWVPWERGWSASVPGVTGSTSFAWYGCSPWPDQSQQHFVQQEGLTLSERLAVQDWELWGCKAFIKRHPEEGLRTTSYTEERPRQPFHRSWVAWVARPRFLGGCRYMERWHYGLHDDDGLRFGARQVRGFPLSSRV